MTDNELGEVGVITVAVVVLVILVAIYSVVNTPTAGIITSLTIVSSHTDWQYANNTNGGGTIITQYVPTAFRVSFKNDKEWTSHCDVPESVWRKLKVGQYFDSKRLADYYGD